MRRALLTSSLLLSLALPLANARGESAPAAPAMHVDSCQVIAGGELPHKYDIGLAVRFENDSPVAYSSIVWRATYLDVPVDFIDDGTFSPQTQIDNYLLFENGSTKILWFNLLAGIYLAAHGAYDSAPITKDNVELTPFIGTPYPENCTIVRAIDANGQLWLNPDVPQNLNRALVAPTPAPAASHKPAALAPPVDRHHLSGPIEIEHCILWLDAKQHLSITYKSDADRPADRIVFRARYAASGLDFTDIGTFSEGTHIVHSLRADAPQELQHITYLGYDDPNLCDAVSVHYADGTSWVNDAVPATAPPLPTPPPNAIELMKARVKWTQRHAFPTPLPSASPQR